METAYEFRNGQVLIATYDGEIHLEEWRKDSDIPDDYCGWFTWEGEKIPYDLRSGTIGTVTSSRQGAPASGGKYNGDLQAARRAKQEEWTRSGKGRINFGDGVDYTKPAGNKEKANSKNHLNKKRQAFGDKTSSTLKGKRDGDTFSFGKFTATKVGNQWKLVGGELLSTKELIERAWQVNEKNPDALNKTEQKEIKEQVKEQTTSKETTTKDFGGSKTKQTEKTVEKKQGGKISANTNIEQQNSQEHQNIGKVTPNEGLAKLTNGTAGQFKKGEFKGQQSQPSWGKQAIAREAKITNENNVDLKRSSHSTFELANERWSMSIVPNKNGGFELSGVNQFGDKINKQTFNNIADAKEAMNVAKKDIETNYTQRNSTRNKGQQHGIQGNKVASLKRTELVNGGQGWARGAGDSKAIAENRNMAHNSPTSNSSRDKVNKLQDIYNQNGQISAKDLDDLPNGGLVNDKGITYSKENGQWIKATSNGKETVTSDYLAKAFNKYFDTNKPQTTPNPTMIQKPKEEHHLQQEPTELGQKALETLNGDIKRDYTKKEAQKTIESVNMAITRYQRAIEDIDTSKPDVAEKQAKAKKTAERAIEDIMTKYNAKIEPTLKQHYEETQEQNKKRETRLAKRQELKANGYTDKDIKDYEANEDIINAEPPKKESKKAKEKRMKDIDVAKNAIQSLESEVNRRKATMAEQDFRKNHKEEAEKKYGAEIDKLSSEEINKQYLASLSSKAKDDESRMRKQILADRYYKLVDQGKIKTQIPSDLSSATHTANVHQETPNEQSKEQPQEIKEKTKENVSKDTTEKVRTTPLPKATSQEESSAVAFDNIKSQAQAVQPSVTSAFNSAQSDNDKFKILQSQVHNGDTITLSLDGTTSKLYKVSNGFVDENGEKVFEDDIVAGELK